MYSTKITESVQRDVNAAGLMNMYELQGLGFEGGGERKGMDGIAIGIVGMEGMFGSEFAGRGGKLSFGRVIGIVGKLGSGGKVGLGSWDG